MTVKEVRPTKFPKYANLLLPATMPSSRSHASPHPLLTSPLAEDEVSTPIAAFNMFDEISER